MNLTPEQMFKLFFHRSDVFAVQQKTGAYFPNKRKVTIKDVEKHLKGEWTIGAYCLRQDSTVTWACIDIDVEGEAELRRAKKEAESIYDLYEDYGRILEFSGRRGYHIWIFFKTPVKANYAQKLVKARLNRVGLLRHEVFPKQTELNENRKYGNLVKIPLGTHKMSGKKSVIIRMDGIK